MSKFLGQNRSRDYVIPGCVRKQIGPALWVSIHHRLKNFDGDLSQGEGRHVNKSATIDGKVYFSTNLEHIRLGVQSV